MAGRIVVLGATGYTGRLVVGALLRRGHTPVVAGRDARRLERLAADHGGLPHELADTSDPPSVRRLVEQGDVLVTTVGPFTLLGRTALDAAVDAGAHYVDSTGEAGFIRHVFEVAGPRAERAGSTLLTAFGSDWVPGNIAGALALHAATEQVRRLDIGYFPLPGARSPGRTGDRHRWRRPRSAASSGTLASMLAATAAPQHTYRGGKLVTASAGAEQRTFRVGNRHLPAFSIGGTEQFLLPRYADGIDDVEVYLGWFGAASPIVRGIAQVTSLVGHLPPAETLLASAARGVARRTGVGPSAEERALVGSRVVAVATYASGNEAPAVRLEGPVNPYELTAELLSWASIQLATGAARCAGASGPLDAFGLGQSLGACRDAGLTVSRAEADR